MSIVDWRELYASNRAAIERSGRTHLPASPMRMGGHAVAARRHTLVHRPAGVDPSTAVPLVCMLHGCTQDAAGFSAATRMNAAADRHGFVAVHPQQERGENPLACWNWFAPAHQARGAGEPASIAAVVRDVMESADQAVDPRRVFVAGLSAGGAMATVLGNVYPDVFAAVAVHSGLAYRSATGPIAAYAAMARGGKDPAERGRAAHAAMGELARVVPTMVVHGTADRTVAPVNADQVLRQSMTANRLADPVVGDLDPASPTATSRGQAAGGRRFESARWTDRRGALVHERLTVDGLGHAWSGGTAGGSCTDPAGPDATEAILRFFAEVSAGG